MSILTGGQWEAPFWGAEGTFITGQDMLGMQNTSIATYAILLPGLTNLTRRIRYYGFYTWLLEEYAKRKGKVSIVEFRRFIRRGELLLAFVMSHAYPEEQGVVGSQYAKATLYEGSNVINIAEGADLTTDHRTYWKYSTGAFGQYYQGTLTSTGLIGPSEREKQISVCTADRGRKLAECFKAAVDEETQERYIATIDNGYTTVADLKLFADEFALMAISPQTEEWHFYIDILFGQDYPEAQMSAGHSLFRRETILLYLEYLKNDSLHTDANTFQSSFYLHKWEKQPFVDYPASYGWYYYALNEYAHYGMETILWTLLVELDDRGNVELQRIVKDITDGTIKAFSRAMPNVHVTVDMSFEALSRDLYESDFQPWLHADVIQKAVQKNSHGAALECAARAVCILGLIFQHDIQRMENLRTYASSYNMSRDGDVLQLLEWMRKCKALPLPDFLARLLLQQIVNRHIEVSMRKMQGRNENTLKFQFEDNMLRRIDIAGPVWTGPRLSSLHQFLVDLKLVDNGQKLTGLGEQIAMEKQL